MGNSKTIAVYRADGDTSKPLPPWARRVCAAVKLGDKIHAVALPIARAAGLPCIDPATKQLRPESKCAGRRHRYNGE